MHSASWTLKAFYVPSMLSPLFSAAGHPIGSLTLAVVICSF
jgi:hypothetical protein